MLTGKQQWVLKFDSGRGGRSRRVECSGVAYLIGVKIIHRTSRKGYIMYGFFFKKKMKKKYESLGLGGFSARCWSDYKTLKRWRLLAASHTWLAASSRLAPGCGATRLPTEPDTPVKCGGKAREPLVFYSTYYIHTLLVWPRRVFGASVTVAARLSAGAARSAWSPNGCRPAPVISKRVCGVSTIMVRLTS